MKAIGEGLAYAGLCLSAAWVEVSGESAAGLWAVVVLWWIFTDWGQK